MTATPPGDAPDVLDAADVAYQGHVELRPRRGAWVSAWTADDIAEVYGVRALLESYGAQIAAQKVGPNAAGASQGPLLGSGSE